ncbi:LUD domain-containing protein [uncultured Capnocytophaga sp.]|jgi:hypothetical protein|uniref:LUD domain-containing protein n=1 Tax=uncultured Capnocytophaga sp. TaxID=159273 RepID=UPI000F1DA7B8|nr:LUD domain-containing protein [uncultured Capnocytophaga sp.]RKW10017.1 MAG: hypothetical protein D8H93_20640 [Capnocytophaga sp.]
MKWLEKLFKTFSKEPEKPQEQMKHSLPVDEAFVHNFKEKGGIFVYIETLEELPSIFEKILLENNREATVFTHNASLEAIFYSSFSSYFEGDDQKATFFLTDCEYLVAQEGSILFSSRQLGQKRLEELPPVLIVVAKTSQIVGSLRDAMAGVNRKTQTNRPNNIRALRGFESPKEKDSIFAESCYRTTYLLLIEDLNHTEE